MNDVYKAPMMTAGAIKMVGLPVSDFPFHITCLYWFELLIQKMIRHANTYWFFLFVLNCDPKWVATKNGYWGFTVLRKNLDSQLQTKLCMFSANRGHKKG